MKIKFKLVMLLASFLSVSSISFAKDSELKINVSVPKLADNDILEVKTDNLEKAFAEAEKYYNAAKSWNKLKCQPKTGFICSKWECKKRDIKAYLILDKKAKTFTRCESDICDEFPAEFKQTGVFYNIQSEGPVGTLIRILGNSRYKEISTVGLDAYIVNGNCEELQ
jgi:hypothetical protein